MTFSTKLSFGCALIALTSAQLQAQDAPAEAQANNTVTGDGDRAPGDAIVVRGERLRGQLDVEQAPVLELNEEDIQALGATSVADLLEAISPQTGSSRGRNSGPPVFLVNGIRIGSFREMRSYPPEAIAKVEVLPEEVAQRFGYPPDRRVVNMILKENFSSRELEAAFEAPDRGGYWRTEQEATLLTIDKGSRLNFNVETRDLSMLTEAERGVIQADGSRSDLPGDPDPAQYRSLVPDTFSLEATANWAKAILESGSSISLNATYEREESRSLSGLNTVLLTDPSGNSALRTFGENSPLERRTSSDKYSLAGSLNRRVGQFDLTTTFDAIIADSETQIDRRAETQALVDAALAGTLALDGILPSDAGNGFDTASTRTVTTTSKATLRGNPLDLPAGEVSTTFNLDFDWKRIESDDTRSNSAIGLTRRRLRGGVNVTVPIAERDGAWGKIGSLSANFDASVEDLSDFGTLNDWSAGLTWGVADNLTLAATYIESEAAPSLSQLGNPQVQSFNVPVFDFVRGETVLATIISGGNPDLKSESRKDWKFSLNWELPFWENTRFSVDYVRNRSNDVTGSLPLPTAEIEAAFPDRITRDASGRLILGDVRPVTFAATRAKRLSFGLVTRGSFGKARPQGMGAGGPPRDGAAPPRGPGRFGPPGAGGPGAGRPGGPPSEEQRAAFMRFRERVCADDGEAVLLQLAEAVARGDDLSQQFPDFDPERAARMVERFRAEDGSIDREQIARFRERICSFDPSAMGRGGPGGGGAGPAGASQGQGQPSQPRSGRRRGLPVSGPGGDGRGRYFLSLTHTVELENMILIADGGPLLDLLDGDAADGSGKPRHSARLEAGLFRNGWGMRVSGTYTGKTRIDGSGLPGSTDLHFADLARFDLRVFADLGQVFRKDAGFLKNFRISLRADNVFDARRRVTDSNGDVPLSYQPFLIDPTGRYLGIDFRKLF
ncbi:TonB-dependent receptor domain-containing protein [Altererythrobacter sp.]|uniref:TonB-dependent receptor domain-containing protein n=1 Tax=Altererythrobacter sp. TaxID=1872480 RepID=UPI003D0FE089